MQVQRACLPPTLPPSLPLQQGGAQLTHQLEVGLTAAALASKTATAAWRWAHPQPLLLSFPSTCLALAGQRPLACSMQRRLQASTATAACPHQHKQGILGCQGSQVQLGLTLSQVVASAHPPPLAMLAAVACLLLMPCTATARQHMTQEGRSRCHHRNYGPRRFRRLPLPTTKQHRPLAKHTNTINSPHSRPFRFWLAQLPAHVQPPLWKRALMRSRATASPQHIRHRWHHPLNGPRGAIAAAAPQRNSHLATLRMHHPCMGPGAALAPQLLQPAAQRVRQQRLWATVAIPVTGALEQATLQGTLCKARSHSCSTAAAS